MSKTKILELSDDELDQVIGGSYSDLAYSLAILTLGLITPVNPN